MFSDPQFWVLIAFIIFVGAIFNPVRKIITGSLDNKISEIKNSINDAEQIKNDAQLALSEIKKRQNKVNSEIQKIKEDANKKVKIIEENFRNKLTEQIDKREGAASLKIDQMLRDANNEIQVYITDTSVATSINILKAKLDKNEKQNLIDLLIKDVNSILKN